MSQYILLQQFDDEGFSFEVSSTGRRLTLEEALGTGLVTRDQLRRHERSDWTNGWYEIVPGDEIVFRVRDRKKGNVDATFVVPSSGLLNPPSDLDDWRRTGEGLLSFFRDAGC